MNFVLLGVGIGLLTLLPPGPVTLALVQVGARQGHRSALRGAAGIASGDVVLGVAALAIVGLGATLPASVFTATRALAALALIAIGGSLIAHPSTAATSVDRIRRPGRTMFLLTSFTPTALGAWIALLAAMPFADDLHELGRFALGVMVASCLWHPLLGAVASSVGARLTEGGQARLSRAGGVIMAGIGLALVAGYLG